jgi:drug/metabolite transporter, DME family
MNDPRGVSSPDDDADQRLRARQALEGTALGILAAVAYTTANLGLRNVAAGGDLDWALFVSANKAVPVTLIAWALVAWRASRGLPGLPPRRLWLPLVLTGFVMQFGGNVMFQFALSRGGLALTVPLTFSTILISGAALGRIVLGEAITPRILLAMGTMMVAVAVLSQGADTASRALVVDADWRSTVLAVITACLSGIGYGSGGVMIRRCVTSNLSYSATIVFISSVGLFVMGPLAVVRLGLPAIAAVSSETWLSILAAGVFNAIAFFAVHAAFKRLSVVRVNLLNASQAAMAAIAGVVLFAEPNTWWLQVGTLLTVTGLVLSARREKPQPTCVSSGECATGAAAAAPAASPAAAFTGVQDHVD